MYKIDINNDYYVIIKVGNHNLYQLFMAKTITKNLTKSVLLCEGFNRDCFLLKANKYIKINSKLENLIASY